MQHKTQNLICKEYAQELLLLKAGWNHERIGPRSTYVIQPFHDFYKDSEGLDVIVADRTRK